MNQAARTLAGGAACLVFGLAIVPCRAEEPPFRLYDGVVEYVSNPRGTAFTVELDVRDVNHLAHGSSELLVKIYDPAGGLCVREVIPDDGVPGGGYQPPAAGWDHEAWYYATCYARGLEPEVRWSRFSEPACLTALPRRTFRYAVPAGTGGVYRILLAGVPDHYVTLRLSPDLPHAPASTVNWLHGHGMMYRRSHLYVPRGAAKMWIMSLEMDWPASRAFVLRDPAGQAIEMKDDSRDAKDTERPPGIVYDGVVQRLAYFARPGQYDDQVLTLDVSDGPGDFLVTAAFGMYSDPPMKRPNNTVNALFAPDAATARALQGGALYHDGRTFWHPYQVRYHDWLRTLPPAKDDAPPANLPSRPEYHSPGSHLAPARGSADRIMHDYPAHHNPQALRAALRDMANGLNAMGPGDVIIHGPMKNLAYEMGCYSFFYHRPAWRILQQSDAPEPAKAAIREFILQVGDRLAFCRGGELVNGNSLASLVQALRYCVEATSDPLQKTLFDRYWERFAHGGFGDRIGIGPSGAIQESFGYDENYGSYVLRGWRAGIADLQDPRFTDAYNGVLNFYSYAFSEGLPAGPWSSRTAGGVAGGTYNPRQDAYPWKGLGGSNLTVSVNGANEFFAARRTNYYAVTYHGRLSPTWVGEGFHGQVGYGGGMLFQLHIPGKGQVLAATLNGEYGHGMHASQWRGFHIHSVVGETADGQPLVSANSEHADARLATNVVTSSGEVRQSSVRVYRRYAFEDDAIVCGVRLGPSAAAAVFNLYGGPDKLRGQVREAYEMIPFADVPEKRRKGNNPPPRTRVTALDGKGAPLGPLTETVVSATAVEIDRHGYGCRVEFERPMPVLRGSNDTVLVRLTEETVPSEQVALTYRLKPYVGGSATDGK